MLKSFLHYIFASSIAWLSACETPDVQKVEYCQSDNSPSDVGRTYKRIFFLDLDSVGGSDLLMPYVPIELTDGQAITSPYPIYLPRAGASLTAGIKSVEEVDFSFEQISAKDNLWYVEAKFRDLDSSVFHRESVVYIYSTTEGILFFKAVTTFLPDGQLISHSFRRCDERVPGLRSF